MKDIETMSRDEFLDECYRLYQLDWMAAHGYSPANLAISVLSHLDGLPIDPGLAADEFFAWESDSGFDGELWACRNEFLENEYPDRAYMLRLLPEEMHARYDSEPV